MVNIMGSWSLIAYPRIGILLFVFLMQLIVADNAIAQNSIPSLNNYELSIRGELSILELFDEVERISDFTFSYHSEDLGEVLSSVIDLGELDSQNVYEVLLIVSERHKLRFRQLNKSITVSKDETLETPYINTGNYEIKGQVVDENNITLPGATVQVKGTSKGDATDPNGEFSLELSGEEHVLIVSFIGYVTQEITVTPKDTYVTVVMEPEYLSLEDEILVVGYGTQTKESITGSISKIETRKITETKTANVANSIAGRVPGLIINARGGEPGQEDLEILIRGRSTTGDASPLFVIDGVANRGSFERLNPEDIESISILKDASAAIYGAQAANGVILVTTKRGAVGKPRFSYSNNFSLTQPAQRQQLMDAPQYLTWLDEQNLRYGRPQIFQNIIDDYRSGDNDPNVWANTDWWSVAMDEWSPQYQHNLSLSGGSDNIRYYASGQYLYQDANFNGSLFGYNQTNVRSNIDVTASSILEIGLDLAGRFEVREGADGDGLIRGIYNMAPFESPYYENGLLRNTSRGNILPGTNGLNGGSELNRQVYNTKLNATLDLDKWVPGLSVIGFGAIDIMNQDRRDLQTPYDIYFLNSEDEYENLRDNTGNIRLFQQFDEELSETYHIRVDYKKELKNSSISGFLAYEQNQVQGEYVAASRINLISEDLPFLFTGSEDNMDNDGLGWQSARVNYFGRLNYAYKDKYFVETTFRVDGSQNFNPDNRFGFFPGISAGWRISEEKFWKSTLVEDLKIRASWGLLGNDRVNSFQFLQLYNIGTSSVFGEDPILTTGLTPGRTPNSGITWETAEKTNIGLDMRLASGMLDLTIDGFYEQRSDILAPRNASVPLYTGILLPDENLGRIRNRGVEVSALHRKIVNKDFEYSIGGQFTYARNEIVYIDESQFVPEYQRVEGSPIDFLLVYQANGLYQNWDEINNSVHFPDARPGDVRFADVNGDGVLDADDRILLPYGPTPRIVFGFNFGTSWKGMELNVFLQGQHGAKTIYRPWDVNQDSWYFENRWVSEELTPDAKSPAAWDMSSSTIQNVSTIWVRDNHFLRIKNVEFAYNLPQSISSRMGLSNVRFFATGFNLGFIYNSVGLFDPESRSDTGWYYPQQRVITAGVSTRF